MADKQTAEEQAGTDDGQAQTGDDQPRTRRRRRWIKWLWLIPLAAIAAFFVWRIRRPPEVEVVLPQERMVVQTLTASGRVAGAREVELSVERAGVLVDVPVQEGDEVAAGEVVARIAADVEAAELRQADAAVATARADLSRATAEARTLAPAIEQAEAEVAGSVEQAQERLAAAETRLAELQAGGREEEVREAEASVQQAGARVAQAELDVERADRLAQTDATARAALERARAAARDASARVQQARVQRDQAERDLRRTRRLFDEGVVAEAELERAQTAADTAGEALAQTRAALEQAEVEVARQETLLAVTREEQLDRARTELEAARHELQRAQARLELVSSPARREQIEQQQAEVRAARAGLRSAREAGQARVRSVRLTPAQEQVTVARQRLEEAVAAREAMLARLEQTQVTTPFDGVITELVREAGDVVSPGQAVVRLSEMGWPEVHMEIDERNIALVETGQEAVLTADAYPDEKLSATVARIAPEAETERGIIDVVLRPTHRPPWLRTGMTIDASIVVEGRSELLVLPTSAVVLAEGVSYVYVVEDGMVRRLQVQTGVGGVRGQVVRSGLNTDALCVLEPASVQVGQTVNAVRVQAGEVSEF